MSQEKFAQRRMERRNQDNDPDALFNNSRAGKVFNVTDMPGSKKSGAVSPEKAAGAAGFKALNNQFVPDGQDA